MIPLAVPNISGQEAIYLQECVASTFVSSVGPFVRQFEIMVAQAAGTLEAVATSSGTTGLHAALMAVGVLPGDLVIVPALTFIATANAVAHCHALPFVLDVSRGSWTLDPLQLEQVLELESKPGVDGLPVHVKSGRRISAIIPVYTFGLPADMDSISATAKRFGVPIVADAAAALGATYNKKPIGEMGADLTMFSFNGNKTVTSGGGGAIVGSNLTLVNLVRHLTTTARVGENYDHDRVGFNYRMTNIQAAVGCAQMERFGQFLSKKRFIANFYNEAFSGIESVEKFPEPFWAESACWFSGIYLKYGDPSAFRDTLRAKGVDARSFWKPIHLQKPFISSPKGELTVSTEIWDRIIPLPSSTGISNEELRTVVDTVNETLLK